MTYGKGNALVVEDEKLINWSLVRTLVQWGFEVHPVHTGREALRALDSESFDVVLVDVQLPDMEGIEIARRARLYSPRSVILLLTPFARAKLTLDPGIINGCINKPIDLAALKGTLGVIASQGESSISSAAHSEKLR